MEANKEERQKALIIGTSQIFDIEGECYLVFPHCCQSLFNLPKGDLKKELNCPSCHAKLNIIGVEK